MANSIKDNPIIIVDVIAYTVLSFVAIVCVFIPIILPYRLVRWIGTGKHPFSDRYSSGTFFGD